MGDLAFRHKKKRLACYGRRGRGYHPHTLAARWGQAARRWHARRSLGCDRKQGCIIWDRQGLPDVIHQPEGAERWARGLNVDQAEGVGADGTEDDTIEIQAGYGGRGDDLSRAETQLLRELLATPGVTLTRWKVIAGGEGYEYRTLHEGGDGESLRRYLTMPSLPRAV